MKEVKKLATKTQEAKLCPNCPLVSLLPIVMAERVKYTRQKEPLTNQKICLLLRTFARDHHITFQGCPKHALPEHAQFISEVERLAAKALMRYCEICKRYVPAKRFERHMAKHGILKPLYIMGGEKSEGR